MKIADGGFIIVDEDFNTTRRTKVTHPKVVRDGKKVIRDMWI